MTDKIRYFIIDMDGTFYLSGNLIEGADGFIERVRESGRDFMFFTNNSSNNKEVCCEKLEKMGFPVTQEKIIISTDVAIDFLKKNYPGKSVYLLGNERMTADMQKGGIILTEDEPDIVLLGFDTDITYEKIRRAAKYIAEGKIYLSTHPDVNCPTADGFMPDAGAFIELFYASTGRRPVVLGKPETPTVDYITSFLHCDRSEIAFIGDRLATDIMIGQKHGITSILVFSGVTSKEEYEKSSIRATYTFDSLKDIVL